VAATEKKDALAALMQAALALPILALPTRAGAVDSGEVGFTFLGYKERGLMKVAEPIVWGHVQIAEHWEVRASAALDIVTGASPELVTNVSGRPVQVITGASVRDRRTTADIKVTRRIGDWALGMSRAVSDENDYVSRAFGIEVKRDLNDRNTTVTFAYGRADDRVRSAVDPALDEPRDTDEYLVGLTQVLSPVAIVQTSLQWGRGRGWYNDPYKHTLTFYPDGGVPGFAFDTRPSHRDTFAWVTRYRRHFQSLGTLQADYRFYRDDWGIRSHTLEVAWERALGPSWSLRPALRYYSQSRADFYSPLVPRPQPAILSSDQRLAAFGGISPSLRATLRLDDKWRVEATAGYVYNAANLRAGGGSDTFETLRAAYGILGVSRAF
jgi:hypothetical protein